MVGHFEATRITPDTSRYRYEDNSSRSAEKKTSNLIELDVLIFKEIQPQRSIERKLSLFVHPSQRRNIVSAAQWIVHVDRRLRLMTF